MVGAGVGTSTATCVRSGVPSPTEPSRATPPTTAATATTEIADASAVRRRRERARTRAAGARPAASGASAPAERREETSRSSRSVIVPVLSESGAECGQAAGHARADAALGDTGQRRDLGVLQLFVVAQH